MVAFIGAGPDKDTNVCVCVFRGGSNMLSVQGSRRVWETAGLHAHVLRPVDHRVVHCSWLQGRWWHAAASASHACIIMHHCTITHLMAAMLKPAAAAAAAAALMDTPDAVRLMMQCT